MGATSGRKAAAILDNTEHVLAIEALTAAQALDYRAPLKPAPLTERAQRLVRKVSPVLVEDRALSGEISLVRDLIRDGSFAAILS